MLSAFERIQKAYESDHIAGSWLISGSYGVGKKDFALKVCSLLLNQEINSLNTFHPDIKWLECGLTEDAKKGIQKNILAGKAVDEEIELARKREITVDDVREGIQFLSLKGGSDEWRILIVYLADQMNENAQNALLKVLEEPAERCVLLLLCQNLGKLLPTIKSRCRQIRLNPAPAEILKAELLREFPAAEDIETVIHLSGGSLGFARDIYKNDGVSLYKKMLSLLKPASRLSSDAVRLFAEELSQNQVSFSLVKSFLFDWLMCQIRENAIIQPFWAENWMDLYQEINQMFIDIDRIYLDKKQVLMMVFFKIAEVLHD